MVQDHSGNNNNGSISGALFATGFAGTALFFDGIDDLISIADSDSLDLSDGLSLEAWVRPADLQGSSAVILKERSGNGLAYALYASDSTGAAPSAYVRAGGADVGLVAASPLPLNTWSHVAATFDSQNFQVFVNGVLANQQPLTEPIAATGQPLQIGGTTTYANEFFHGFVDEVRVYNRPLTPAEIRYNMSQPVQGTLDAIAPVGAIVSPLDGQSVSGDLPIQVSANDNIAVSRVELLLNGAPLFDLKRSPYQAILDTRTLTNGSYTLSGSVLDIAGNLASIPSVTFHVVNAADTTPPTIAKLYPTEGQHIAGSSILSAFAHDNAGVVGVQFKVDEVEFGAEDTTLPYRVVGDFTTLADGAHLVSAVARDAAGNTVTQSVTVQVDNTSPAIVNSTPANGTTEVPIGTDVAVTLSEAIRSTGFHFELRNASGAIVLATTHYDETLKQLRLIPAHPLASGATYFINLSGVTDLAGNTLASASWSFTTSTSVNHASFWNSTTIPAVESANDSSAVELGMRFQSSLDGYVAGLRFYKGAGNSGVHVGSLWTNNGTLLGRLTFTSETATGWQQASFDSPIPILANTSYVISYFAPNGRYAANSNYFQTNLTSGPLTAPASGNGLYRYGASSGFPVNSFKATNYWIDVDFTTTLDDVTPPTVVTKNPASGAVDVSLSTDVMATFSESVQPSTISFVLRDPNNNLVPSSLNYDAQSLTATLTLDATLDEATTYTATISATRDIAGNTMQNTSWSFTTFNSVDTTPPVLVSRSPAMSSVGVPTSANIIGTFNESIESTSLVFTLTGPNSQLVPGTIDYNDGTRTVTLDPTETLQPQTNYIVTLDARDLAGNQSSYSWSFTTVEVANSASIWSASTVPSVLSDNDTSAVELGLKFSVKQDGFISSVRFYKGALNTGMHVGKLWTSSGTLLGSATFSNETNSGWQQVDFSTPIAVTANTTYVVSYYAPNGRYSVNSNFFTSGGVVNGSLTALGNGVAGGNGVYRYGSGGGFPSNSYNASNYWVDVVFSTSFVDETPPILVSQSPSASATNVEVTTAISATFNEPVQENAISFVLRDANQTIVPASLNYNSSLRTITLTPNTALENNTTYSVTLSGVLDTAGNSMETRSWSFTTGSPASNVSLRSPQSTPSIASVNDTSAVEVGVKFQSDRDGYVTGIKFYKGGSNTGVHIGNLWAASGNLLAGATFTSETTSGWQTVLFANPVWITANTTYVASYFAPNGGYAFDGNYFATERISGPLRAPASNTVGGNGVYRYGASSGLPTSTFNSANYWVDVLFSETV
ncbi:MAG: DUF4082 domain-containing protein [Pirellulaceae bacterium]|nr:DUF4082 domain-containing protein [Pirellulaceae bacterium]